MSRVVTEGRRALERSWAEDLEQDVPEYVIPDKWTAEHVLHRLVHCCSVLSRVPIRRFGHVKAQWPEYFTEWGDLVEWETLPLEERNDRRFESARRPSRPSSVEIDLMEEALAWPARYLQAEPGVVVMRWATRRARSRHDTREPVMIVIGQAMTIAFGLKRDRVPVR